MPAYLMFVREGQMHDPAAMNTYVEATMKNPPDPNMTPLAIYGNLEALEGEAPDGVLLLQFPTVEAAKNWYSSPGYQAALPFRKKAANYRVFIVQGL